MKAIQSIHHSWKAAEKEIEIGERVCRKLRTIKTVKAKLKFSFVKLELKLHFWFSSQHVQDVLVN